RGSPNDPQELRVRPPRDSPISHALARAPRTDAEAAVPSAEDRFHSATIYQTQSDDERCVDTNALGEGEGGASLFFMRKLAGLAGERSETRSSPRPVPLPKGEGEAFDVCKSFPQSTSAAANACDSDRGTTDRKPFSATIRRKWRAAGRARGR